MTIMRLTWRIVGSAVACVSLSLPAAAHHGYAQYDRCTNVTLEGEIASVEWVNPHIVIDLATTDAKRYRVEWFTLAQLGQANIRTGTLKPGDHVLITGKTLRDPSQRVMSLLSEIRRPSDGWSWEALPPRPLPESCAKP